MCHAVHIGDHSFELYGLVRHCRLICMSVYNSREQTPNLKQLYSSTKILNCFEGADLPFLDTAMAAVMSLGKIAENGSMASQNVKSPSKSLTPSRIGRRNQVRNNHLFFIFQRNTISRQLLPPRSASSWSAKFSQSSQLIRNVYTVYSKASL